MPVPAGELGITKGPEPKTPSSVDRHTLHGFGRFKALLITVPALVAAACGVGGAPTPGATSIRTESPTATVSGAESPTPINSASPTVEVTASATPTPIETPAPTSNFDAQKLAADIQSGAAKTEYPAVTTAKLITDFQTLLAASPAAQADALLIKTFNGCVTPDKTIPQGWAMIQDSRCNTAATHLGNLARTSSNPSAVVIFIGQYVGWALSKQGPAQFNLDPNSVATFANAFAAPLPPTP
jgi:hypothetical protein